MSRTIAMVLIAFSCGCEDRPPPACLETAGLDGGVVRNLMVTLDGTPGATDGGAAARLHILALIPCFSPTGTLRAAVTLSEGNLAGTGTEIENNQSLVTLTPVDTVDFPGLVDGFAEIDYPGPRDVRVTVVVGDASAHLDVPPAF